MPSRWPKAKPLYFPPPSSSSSSSSSLPSSPKPIESLPPDLRSDPPRTRCPPHRSERNRRRLQSTPRRARSWCRDPPPPHSPPRAVLAGHTCSPTPPAAARELSAARAPNWGRDPLLAEACGVRGCISVKLTDPDARRVLGGGELLRAGYLVRSSPPACFFRGWRPTASQPIPTYR